MERKYEDGVSIIMPAYNSSSYIDESIKSVINQSYMNWELIIVDDASIDDTKEIISRFQVNDTRIKSVYFSKNQGAAVARNVAISKSIKRYIAFLDADDIWHPRKLEKQLKFMTENNLLMSYTNYDFIGKKKYNEYYRSSFSKINYKKQLLGNTIGCLTVMFDSSRVGKVNIKPIKKRNDAALWLKILSNGGEAKLLDEVLATHRLTENSLSRSGSYISILKYHFKLYRDIGYSRIASLMFVVSNKIINIYIRYFLLKKKELN